MQVSVDPAVSKDVSRDDPALLMLSTADKA